MRSRARTRSPIAWPGHVSSPALHIATFHHLVVVLDQRGRLFAVAIYPPDCGGTIAVAGSQFAARGHRFVAPGPAPTRMLGDVLIDERRLIEASGQQEAQRRMDENRQCRWAPKRLSASPEAIRKRRRRAERRLAGVGSVGNVSGA